MVGVVDASHSGCKMSYALPCTSQSKLLMRNMELWMKSMNPRKKSEMHSDTTWGPAASGCRSSSLGLAHRKPSNTTLAITMLSASPKSHLAEEQSIKF